MKPSPGQSELQWYIASSGFWLAAMALQMWLMQWLLVFHLEVTPAEFGLSRALMEAPPLVMLLVAGVIADRVDGRRVLIVLSMVACAPPLLVAAAGGSLSYWPVVAFGVAMALLQWASEPSRAAMMNRITRIDIQRTVTLTTLATTVVSLGAIWLGGRLESAGIGYVLALQVALIAIAAATVFPLNPQPPTPGARPDLVAGLRTLWRLPLVRNVIVINFVSSMFNAGAYQVVVPLVVREVYAGDAAFLANMFIAFALGNAGSTVVLLLAMPLRRPGSVFLVMQLTRVAILASLWLEPPTWLFFALIAAWGLNMAVTTTLARTTVQELAPPEHRAKILSILLASFMVSSPISALVLGFVVELGGTSFGLLPGVVFSLAIFVVGRFSSGLWDFESPSHPAAALRPGEQGKQ